MITNIGQIDVKINTSDIGKAIAELNNLGKAASNAQSRLDGLSRINLSGLTGQVSALGKELSSVDKVAAGAAKSIDGIAGKSLGGLSKQITIINNNFSQTQTTINNLNQQFNNFTAIAGSAGGGALGLAGKLGLVAIGLKAIGELSGVLIDVGKYLYDAYQPVQALTMGLNALGKAGAAELSAMRAQASSLGVVFADTARSQLAWAAATQQTSLEGDKGAKVFNSISGAIRLFGGGTEEVNGALKALTQMMSKGTVQSEELKGQLGERLPGAFKLMADALGISTRELTDALKNGMVESGFAIEKLAELIEKRYGEGIVNAANTTQAQLNRMKNDWQTIMAGIGKAVDAVIGKVATWINQWGVLRGIAANFEAGATADGIREAGVRDGTGGAKANRMVADANALLEAKGQTGIKRQALGGGGAEGAARVESAERAFARDLADAISKRAGLAAGGDTRSQAYKDLDTRIKILQEVANNNKDIKQQEADRGTAAARQRKEAADFADASRASQARQEAIRSGDRRGLLALDIAKARKEIEDAAKTMSGLALGEFRNQKLEYIASREAEIAKLDNKDAKAGARAATQAERERDRQLNRADSLLSTGSNELSRLRERYQNLMDPEGIEGEIERVKRLFAERRKGVEELTKLTAKERQETLAKLQADEEASIAEIKKIDAVNDAKKVQKRIEQEISEIVRRRGDFTVRNNDRIANMRADLDAVGKKEEQKPYFDILDTSSAYAKGLKEAVDKVKKQYEKETNEATKNGLALEKVAAEISRDLSSAQKDLSGTERTDANRGLIASLEEKVKQLTDNLKAVRDGQAENDKLIADIKQRGSEEAGAARKTYLLQYQDSRRLDVGVDAGATSYLDSIKNKAERAKEVMVSFGQATEQALMAGSWSEAKNVVKTFFGSLLKQIQQTIVQLLIVKPLMEQIANFANNNFRSGGNDFFSGLLQAVVGGAVGGNVSSSVPAGSSSQYSLSSGGVKLGYNANGGVFAGGQKLNYYANGGVFDRPTLFGGNGLGVMGEAGPEAVMPLKRDAKGRLGVAGGASTSITNQLSITVNGNADKDTIAEMEQRLATKMTEISRQQANNAILAANRPGGANYKR
jgi:tape measure domain-containing protein